MPTTNAIIDLCLPFKLNVAVIGKKNSGRTSYIQAVVKLLTEKSESELSTNIMPSQGKSTSSNERLGSKKSDGGVGSI